MSLRIVLAALLIPGTATAADLALGVRAGYGHTFVLGENPYGLGFGLHGELFPFSGDAKPLMFALDVDVYLGTSTHRSGPGIDYTASTNAYHFAAVIGWDARLGEWSAWKLTLRPEAKLGLLASPERLDFRGNPPVHLSAWTLAPTATPALALVAHHGRLRFGVEAVLGPLVIGPFVSWLAFNTFAFAAFSL